MTWSRRLFLKVLGLAAGSAALGAGALSCSESTQQAEPKSNDGLTQKELDQVVLLSTTIFQPDDERERQELDTTMRWWATGRTTSGPHLELYRKGLAAVDTKGEAYKALKDEILEGIYSSGIGWKSLGYTTWPGVPSGPLEYTTAPHGPTRVLAFQPRAEIIG